uniref:Uncharacterized protein n=1 Tax=Arion vulgaris TaxID=1028688 RepID=A0A0B7AKH8_9EUPU
MSLHLDCEYNIGVTNMQQKKLFDITSENIEQNNSFTRTTKQLVSFTSER